MNSKLLLSPTDIIIVLLVFSIWSSTTHIHVHCKNILFSVTDSGAVPDGTTDNKQAFLDTWKQACGTSGGTVVVPDKGKFVVSEAIFLGPCTGQTNVLINGTVIALSETPRTFDYWLQFREVTGLAISGQGTLDGNGKEFYSSPRDLAFTITSLKFEYVSDGSIEGITSLNSKKFHIGLNNCDGVSVNNVTIIAPADSHNTDGIHLGVCNNIHITKVSIATGDDCISLGDGNTMINITGVTCGPGHGISIGSLGKYSTEKDVRSITVTDCTLIETTNGLRIKTLAPSPSLRVSDITFQHIIMQNVMNPIIIDQHYCVDHAADCSAPANSSVSIESVKFINVQGSSNTPVGVEILCSNTNPCKDIDLTGVNLTFKGEPTTANCTAADVHFFKPITPSSCSSSTRPL